MEKFVYYSCLLDIYASLLTEQKKKIFSLYYEENLTMQEIADILKVSKSFIGRTIKETEKKLDELESNLCIFQTKEKIKDLLELNDLKKIKLNLKKILEND